MELLFLFVVLPAAIFLGLAVLPVGRPALIGHIAVAAIAALLAAVMLPLDPPTGPDNWFYGVELVPVYAAAIGVPFIGAAQLWRWWRVDRGKPSYYVLALAVSAVPILYLFTSL